MMNNVTDVLYKGQVEVSVKIGDRIVSISQHNEGLKSLGKLFAMAVTGYDTKHLTPQYIDLRKRTEDGTYETFLLKELSVSAGSYYEDTTLSPSTWVAEFNASLPFAYLQEVIPYTDDDEGLFYFYLLTQDSALRNGDSRELATLPVSTELLSQIIAGTQAIIQWKLRLVNYSQEA